VTVAGTPHPIAGTLLLAGTRTVASRHGAFAVHLCRDLTRHTYALVLARGDVTAPDPLLARVHSSCVTSETLTACDCDCAEQLDGALAAIAAAGRGVVFYLDQEGRGAGFAAKVRDRMMVQASGGRLGTFEAYARMGLPPDLRSYEAVAAARRLLGITAPLALLTNNPDKLDTLRALGVPLAGAVGLALPPSPFNRHYLAAKAEAGHRLSPTFGVEAEPPGPIAVTEPHSIVEATSLVRIGTYWLPVRAPDGAPGAAHWLRLFAYADLASGRERIVLTHGEASASPVLVRIQREALLERLPGAHPGREKRRWAATVRAFVAHGAGVAVMLDDARGTTMLGLEAPTEPDAATLALVRHHCAGRVAVPLVDTGSEPDWAAHASGGIALGPARTLGSS
jgi:GTP cyclohydrolase II